MNASIDSSRGRRLFRALGGGEDALPAAEVMSVLHRSGLERSDARIRTASDPLSRLAAERAEKSAGLRSSPVKSAVKQALGARLAESRRYVSAHKTHKTPARSRLEDRPDFDLNFTARRSEETPGREAFSPIAVRYPDGSPGASFNVADEAAKSTRRPGGTVLSWSSCAQTTAAVSQSRTVWRAAQADDSIAICSAS